MAFAAAAARRSLASRGLVSHLAHRFHPAHPHLLPSDSIGDASGAATNLEAVTQCMYHDIFHDPCDQKTEMAKDNASIEEACCAALSSLKKMGLPVFTPFIVTPYTLITLYIAISNMVENVPSLKGGGAFWFTDLTTPDALCIFPMLTSLFLVLTFEVKNRSLRTGSSHEKDKVRKVLLVLYLLCTPLTATLPQAISCSFVTWSFGSFAERIALNQPAVRKLLFGAPLKPSSSSHGQKGPTAEDSPSPVKEHEEPVPPEKRKSSDASVHRVRDQSGKKSTKGG